MEQEQIEQTAAPRRRRRTPYQINRRLQGRLLSLLLVGAVTAFLVLGLLQKDRTFSDSENRKLASFPALSAWSDGTFLRDLGSYAADQFPFRDGWIALNLRMNRLLGSREVNGVYLCDDDYLMQIPGEPNEAQLRRNLEAVNGFAAAHPELRAYMTVVPNAVTVLSRLLPPNAPVRDQAADLAAIAGTLQNVEFLDVTDALTAHSSENLYYRTDHHWTSLGARYAFEAMAPAMELSQAQTMEYTVYPVSRTFEGTLSSKSGSHTIADTVEIYVPKTEIDYCVNDPGTGEMVSSFYDRSALDKKDHYTVFFGGNYPRLDVITTADTGRSLLLFKDSYANCMVQFLYPYFDHITLIDPRYYYDNVELVLKSEGITDVLWLYNLDTFLSDTSLADVLCAGA